MWTGFSFFRSCCYFFRNLSAGQLFLLAGQSMSILTLAMEMLNSIMAISQAHVFSSGRGRCAAFLANYHTTSAARVLFNNMHYDLPPWSISILPDCRNAVFNTARVSKVLAFIAIHVRRKNNWCGGVGYFMLCFFGQRTDTIVLSKRWEYKLHRCKCCLPILNCSHGRLMVKIFLL